MRRREDGHRFANAEEVQMVYDALERPLTVRGVMACTPLSCPQVQSALKVLEYKGTVVERGPENNRRYQWRR